jgi:hypothetical protein
LGCECCQRSVINFNIISERYKEITNVNSSLEETINSKDITITSKDNIIKKLQEEIHLFEETVLARNATIKDSFENRMTLDVATDQIISDISNDIISIAAFQKNKPVNFYTQDQINYSDSKFIIECNKNGTGNMAFTSFIQKVIESTRRLGNLSINKSRANDSTKEEMEKCLAFIIAHMLDFLLRSNFHFDGSNLPLLWVYQQTGSELVIDGLANLLPGALGGARVSQNIHIFAIILITYMIYTYAYI